MNRRRRQETRALSGSCVGRTERAPKANDSVSLWASWEIDREKKGFLLIGALLLLFGVSNSIVYFGHQPVPNPDFIDFINVGHDLWSFHIPHDFKRGPMLGLLIVPLGWLCGGATPDITGGWLLNAILHPFNLLLLWLVCRQIVGKAGLWIALLAIINPQTLCLLTEPIAETLLLFFVLLSFYLLFRRSQWAYLAGAMAAMVRYEAAALILAAFVMDMAYAENRKARLLAFRNACLSGVPLFVWLLATALRWNQQSGIHYIKLLSLSRIKEMPLVLKQLWSVTFSSYLVTSPGLPANWYPIVTRVIMILSVVLAAVSAIESILRRNWKIIALLIFFVPYMLIHIVYEFTVPRFYATVHWIFLVLFWYGSAD